MTVPSIVKAAALPLTSTGILQKLAEGDSPLHDVKPKYDWPIIKTLLEWLAELQGTGLIVIGICFVIAVLACAFGKAAFHSSAVRDAGFWGMVVIGILGMLVGNAPQIIEWMGYQQIVDASSMGALLIPGLL